MRHLTPDESEAIAREVADDVKRVLLAWSDRHPDLTIGDGTCSGCVAQAIGCVLIEAAAIQVAMAGADGRKVAQFVELFMSGVLMNRRLIEGEAPDGPLSPGPRGTH